MGIIEDIVGVVLGAFSSSIFLIIVRALLSTVIPAPIVDIGVIVFSIYALYEEGEGVLGAASAGALIVALIALFWDVYLDLTLP